MYRQFTAIWPSFQRYLLFGLSSARCVRLLAPLVLLFHAPLPAQETPSLCPAPAFEITPSISSRGADGDDALDFSDPDSPVVALADRIESRDGIVRLNGKTQLQFQGREILAENAVYDSQAGTIAIDGDLTYQSDGVALTSSDARIDLKANTFSMADSVYQLNIGDRLANGSADSLSRDASGVFRLTNATYSACPPSDMSWFIQAEEIRLDTDNGIGTADKILLNFKGVPLLPVPRFSFPISHKRKTGFLAPTMASNDNTGIELYLPWYWNVRPYLDVTLTPRFTSRRGTQLQTQIRYLNAIGKWQLDSEIMRDNTMPRDQRTRRFTRFSHDGHLGQYWETHLDINAVTDREYFDDLGDSLSIASITHLQRLAELRASRRNLRFTARLQDFQTVDPDISAEDRPYRRLPQLLLETRWPSLLKTLGNRVRVSARSGLDAEMVNFTRDNSIGGLRFDFNPFLSMRLNHDAWFLNPRLGLRFSHYRLDNLPSPGDDDISRFVGTASVDTGMFFDRKVDENGSLQTLEPRIFLLYVPYTDQQDIPAFDSFELDFNISQLFRENRFSGADRIADSRQLSAALTTRYIDGKTGRETLRAGIGQIYYFSDRRVWLEPDRVETRDVSDIVTEISTEIADNWLVRANVQYNSSDDHMVRSSLLVSYQTDNNHIFNFARRVVDTGGSAQTDQLDISARWPFRRNWLISGRWNYSLDGDTSIDTMLGIEYQSCCWAYRFAARRHIADSGHEHDNSYYFQLVLKGLAPLGDNIGQLLRTSVFGYQDNTE